MTQVWSVGESAPATPFATPHHPLSAQLLYAPNPEPLSCLWFPTELVNAISFPCSSGKALLTEEVRDALCTVPAASVSLSAP